MKNTGMTWKTQVSHCSQGTARIVSAVCHSPAIIDGMVTSQCPRTTTQIEAARSKST
jgi:hypothetical protein